MAAITTAADGNHDVGATWTGGVVPGNGDTVIMNHNVTVVSNWTVGSSPATGGTAAIDQQTNNKNLVINAGVTLTLRGDLLLQSGAASTTYRLDVAAGGGVEFDASAAASPSTTKYKLRPNKASAQRGRIRFAGTVGSRCFLRSNAGGANAWIDRGGFTDVLEQFDAVYTDFTRIGDATNPFWDFLLASVAKVFKAANCVFDGCGQLVSGTTVFAGSTLNLNDSTWKNSAHATRCVQLPDFTNSGTKTLTGTVFDKEVFIGDGAYDFTNAYFHNSFAIASRTTAAIMVGVLKRKDSATTTNLAGDLIDSIVLKDGVYGNPHSISCGSWDRVFTITGNVFVYTGAAADGDAISGNNPAAARKHTVSGNVMLPLASGSSAGKFISMGGGANVSWDVYHNTFPSDRINNGSEIAVSWGETYAGYAGIYANVKSNLAWCPTAARAIVVIRYAGTVQDGVAPANATHNGTWNGRTGSDGVGYDSHSAGNGWTSAPGANHVNVVADPFVDRLRTIATWDTSLGGPGTVANALTELQKRNDAAGYNSAYNITALRAYLRDGFKVTDAGFNNAGHDGITIGAMAYQAPASGIAKHSAGYHQRGLR